MKNQKYTTKNQLYIVYFAAAILAFVAIGASWSMNNITNQKIDRVEWESSQLTYREVAHMSDVIGDAFDIQVEKTNTKINALNLSIEKLDSKIERMSQRTENLFIEYWMSYLTKGQSDKLMQNLDDLAEVSTCTASLDVSDFLSDYNSEFSINRTTVYFW